MTFTFKLAKRISHSRRFVPRLAAALIFLAGCADSVGTEPTDPSTPDTAIAYNAASIMVTPGSASGSVGESAQFSAVIRDINGIAITGHKVTWSASNSAVVRVSASGYATAVGGGTTTVNASYNGIVGRATVTVVGATITVAKVVLTPKPIELAVGATQQFAAVVTDAAGAALPTVGVQWVTTNSSVVKIDSTGLASALTLGTVKIIARAGGKADTASVNIVNSAPVSQVASVTVAPGSASGNVGDAAQFSATVKDAAGNTLAGQTVTWSSSNSAVVTVSASGYATAVGGGSASLVATAGGKSGQATITVVGGSSSAPVATVALSPGSLTLPLGGIQTIGATLKDANGNVLTGRTVTWTSSSPLVATISTLGLVTGLVSGNATITATSEGKSATATVTVSAGSPPPPPPPGGEPAFQSGQQLIWRDTFDGALSDAAVLANYITLRPEFIHADATAGLSGSGALRFDWQASTSCQDDSRLIEQGITPTREIYVTYSVRYTPNFQYDWRNRSPCTGNAKKLFFLYSVSGSRFDFISENHSMGMGSDYDHPLFQQNQNSAMSVEQLGDGSWHRITIHVLQSSTPTATDGIIEGWVDGVQRWSYRNVASNASGGWNYFHFPSTFNQGSPVTQSEWIDDLAVWKP